MLRSTNSAAASEVSDARLLSRDPDPRHARRRVPVVLGVGEGEGVVSQRIPYAAAAKHLGLKIQTLRTMVHRRQVPHIRLGPKLVVFDTDVLDAWLNERSVAANEEKR